MRIFSVLAILAAFFIDATAASAKIEKFPPGMRTDSIVSNGATIYVRVGGKGRPCCSCTALATPATCGRR